MRPSGWVWLLLLALPLGAWADAVAPAADSLASVEDLEWQLPGARRSLFGDSLGRAILRSHRFLDRREQGLPFADDPRSVRPPSEKVRLLIDTQALGYLNLYKLSNQRRFLKEATDRLDFILAMGRGALGRWGGDGQLGYSFLLAYELSGERRFLEAGLGIAEDCRSYADNIMNWGYLAALNLGRGWRLTGRPEYLRAARWTTRNTASRQFADGAFPHRERREYGKNTHYTAWLLLEMLLHRGNDPDDPDMDTGILRGVPFLVRRVNPDGSINYEDEDGTYHADPGNADSRGWMNELPAFVFVLRALGRENEAARVLRFLLAHEMRGHDRGGYADKWGYPDPNNPMATGAPSVIRTSIVFWFLTEIAVMNWTLENGRSVPCSITRGNCSPAFEEFGLCDAGLVGHDVCINGVYTRCIDETAVTYRPGPCVERRACVYDPREEVSRVIECSGPGEAKCVAWVCRDECALGGHMECQERLEQGDACSSGPGTVGVAGPGGGTRGDGPPELRAGPNPVREGVVLAFELRRAGLVRLAIYGVDGRRIGTLMSRWLNAGPHEVRWHGVDGEGAAVRAGVYFARLATPDGTATTRLVVVR